MAGQFDGIICQTCPYASLLMLMVSKMITTIVITVTIRLVVVVVWVLSIFLAVPIILTKVSTIK